MTTKVLLIYPQPSLTSPQKSPPLSILYVGEALRTAKERGKSDEDYQVRYYDERYDLNPDLDWPDVVGVSSMTGYQLQGAIHWLKAAKAHGKRSILGGIHATMQPDQCLAEDYVDAVVLSEGENAVIEAIHGGHKRTYLSHLKGGDHVSPVSQETLVHFQRSARTGDTILLTSRGCPFRCGFCFNQQFYERHWSTVDMNRWEWDVKYLRDNAGVTKLEHGDDWPGQWSRVKYILEYLKGLGITYRPSLRANQINLDVAREMAALGMKHISIGMESGSPRILELVQKDITRSDQIRAAVSLAQVGIWPLYYWITNFPTETEGDLNLTLDAMDEMDAIHRGQLTQNAYCYLPLPGTALYDLVDKSTLPQTIAGWSNHSLNNTDNDLSNALYHCGGLHFHKGKGEKTDRNFPGLSRALIAPFEAAADWRWRHRYFKHYHFEKQVIERLLEWAGKR